MDIKLLFGVVAALLTIIGFIPYIKSITLRETKPHTYTWLIWLLTQGTATLGLLVGGGSTGALSLVVGLVLVFFIFVLSFKYGTNNITRSDTLVLIFALVAILVWWQLDNPLLAVLMVSAIDGFGYIPTLRKTYIEPWTETSLFWTVMAIASLLTIAATAEYNLLTTTYLAVITAANTITATLCIWRQKVIAKPITAVQNASESE